MAYGSAAAVAYLVKHLTNAGTFDTTASSKVTSTAVAQFLTDVSAEIDLILASQGYAVPVATPATAKAFLDRLAVAGAAMFCELTQATAGFRGAENADTRAGAFRRLYEDGLKRISSTQGLLALGLGQGTATTRGLWSGSTEDEDGNAKAALFEREMWDNPGTGLDASDADEEA